MFGGFVGRRARQSLSALTGSMNMDDQNITLVVRARDGARQVGPVDDWRAYAVIASLSANPTSFDELVRACERYRFDEGLADLDWGVVERDSPDENWVLCDLACRRVIGGKQFVLPENGGVYEEELESACEADQASRPGVSREPPLVWINLAPGWVMETAEGNCFDSLGSVPELFEPIDVRGTLYGRSFASDIARRVLHCQGRESLPDRFVSNEIYYDSSPPTSKDRQIEQRWHKLAMRVHADWLMTEREDLGGQAPRLFLHRDRSWVERELENRASQWSRQRSAPPALGKDTMAYRFGPVGLHEVVVYFGFCRWVINEAWREILSTPEISESHLANELYRRSKDWLQREAALDGEGPAPAAIIESERRLLPLVGDMCCLDCECPMCKAMADNPAPAFAWFDGHQLDLEGDFAFSLYDSRREWEWGPGHSELMDDEPAAAENPSEGG